MTNFIDNICFCLLWRFVPNASPKPKVAGSMPVAPASTSAKIARFLPRSLPEYQDSVASVLDTIMNVRRYRLGGLNEPLAFEGKIC